MNQSTKGIADYSDYRLASGLDSVQLEKGWVEKVLEAQPEALALMSENWTLPYFALKVKVMPKFETVFIMIL